MAPEPSTPSNRLVQAWRDLEIPAGLYVELLDGELVMQANPGSIHDLPGRAFVRRTPEPFAAWSERGVFLADDYRPRADAVVVRAEDTPLTMDDWPSQILLAVVETVSTTRAAIKRDWEDKRLAYAAAGIPVYVIVDPNDAGWHVLELDGSRYVETTQGVFGQPLRMPDPMDFTIDTHGWHPYA
ncbi:Uma2 family endonuclease [Streptacidiphilus carbonis]|jgi:Uma2 family endonuclease|uniref:Uma2 family endonuclease n=1 Tax=Streptacidiphilus carbonis TaxID=105422 RepID=UPI0005A7D4F0|nr:Uma2 family endonuclease [Streptacidiphilus carbonis]